MAQKCECRTISGKNGYVKGQICDCGQQRSDGYSVGAIAPPQAMQRRGDSRASGAQPLTPQQQRRMGNYKRSRADARSDSAWRADAVPQPPAPQPQAGISPSAQRRMENYKRPLAATKQNRPQ